MTTPYHSPTSCKKTVEVFRDRITALDTLQLLNLQLPWSVGLELFWNALVTHFEKTGVTTDRAEFFLESANCGIEFYKNLIAEVLTGWIANAESGGIVVRLSDPALPKKSILANLTNVNTDISVFVSRDLFETLYDAFNSPVLEISWPANPTQRVDCQTTMPTEQQSVSNTKEPHEKTVIPAHPAPTTLMTHLAVDKNAFDTLETPVYSEEIQLSLYHGVILLGPLLKALLTIAKFKEHQIDQLLNQEHFLDLKTHSYLINCFSILSDIYPTGIPVFINKDLSCKKSGIPAYITKVKTDPYASRTAVSDGVRAQLDTLFESTPLHHAVDTDFSVIIKCHTSAVTHAIYEYALRFEIQTRGWADRIVCSEWGSAADIGFVDLVKKDSVLNTPVKGEETMLSDTPTEWPPAIFGSMTEWERLGKMPTEFRPYIDGGILYFGLLQNNTGDTAARLGLFVDNRHASRDTHLSGILKWLWIKQDACQSEPWTPTTAEQQPLAVLHAYLSGVMDQALTTGSLSIYDGWMPLLTSVGRADIDEFLPAIIL